MKTGESGLTVFRLLTKENRWKWVQANARLVYKNGKPDYIIATQRPLLYVPVPSCFVVNQHNVPVDGQNNINLML